MTRLCKECKKVKIQGHKNKKYCEDCRLSLVKKPKGTMTKDQIAFAIKNKNKLSRHEICKKLNESLSNLKRSCKGIKFEADSLKKNKYKTNPDLVKEVLKYYEKNGRKKTQEKFKDIKVRSITEKYKDFKPLQTKWENQDILEAAKMAGLISVKAQIKYFSHRGIGVSGIRHLWDRRFGTQQSNLHGIPLYKAKHFVLKSAPALEINFGKTKTKKTRKIILWVDAEKHLKKDCPEFIKDSIKSMAIFQRRLFKVKNVKQKIKRMIQQREV